MSNVTLILGPVVFQDFEVVDGVKYGGEQRLAVHQLPGGTRVIDAMGREDAEIRICGIFSGSDATLRSRLVDELRASGLPLPMTWDVYLYTVVIKAFRAEYRNGHWIPFELVCTVLRDEAGALIDTALSLVASIAADLTAAQTFGSSGLDFMDVQADAASPGATTVGTGSYNQALSGLDSLHSAIGAQVEGTGDSLTQAGSSINATNDPQAGTLLVNGAASSAAQLGALGAARGYVGRALVNLKNAST